MDKEKEQSLTLVSYVDFNDKVQEAIGVISDENKEEIYLLLDNGITELILKRNTIKIIDFE